MMPGDLLEITSLATAWRFSHSFRQLGKLQVGELLIFYGKDSRLYLKVLSRLGVCCMYGECVELCTDETR